MSKVTMIFGISLVLLVYGGANVYIGHRLYRWGTLLLPSMNAWVFAYIYGIIALTFLLAFAPLPKGINDVATTFGSYWMGIFIYLFLCIAVVDILVGIGALTGIIPKPVPDIVRFWAGLSSILMTISFVTYGIYNATIIKEVRYDIQLKEGVTSPNLKMVMLSDLHLGAVRSETRLEEIVERVNTMEPDIIVIPGDIFNDDFTAIQDPKRVSDLFKQLKATYGVYGTLGNHDGGKTFSQMVQLLEESNITLLNDEYVVIDDKLALVGRVDPSPIGGFNGLKRQDVSHLLKEIDSSMPTIVLDHTPSNLEQYSNDVDLILSGHTHRGQIFPGSLITNLVFEVDYGHFQKNADSPQIIVTSGVGTWGMPMRVGTNNEIVEIYIK